MPIAYSYLRFSDPKQEKGDSTKRQLEARDRFLAANPNIVLDTSLTLDDKGISAYRGKNLTEGALGQFIRLVEAGKIKSGSYLIVEKLDRFSRTDVDVALSCFSKLVKSGIKIVQLDPERIYDADSIRGFGLMELVVHFIIANEESAKKSYRLGNAWKSKRENIDNKKLTGMVPHWLTLSDDKTSFIQDPEKVAIVKRIFKMAISGLGQIAILKTFNAEGIGSIARGKSWQPSYIKKILHNRAVIGEFQPMKLTAGRNSKRIPQGELKKDYYPAIISESDFYKAQEALASRVTKRGPAGKRVSNLFTGLLFTDGGFTMNYVDKGKRSGPQVVSSGAKRGVKGAGDYVAFGYKALEDGFLRFTKELKSKDLFQVADSAEDEIEGLAAKKANIEKRLAKIKAKLEESDENLDSMIDLMASLDKQKNETGKQLEAAKSKQHKSSIKEVLQESQDLIAKLDKATGDELYNLRTIVRSKMSELMERIDISIRVLPGLERRAFCRVKLKSGMVRILVITTKKGKPAESWSMEYKKDKPFEYQISSMMKKDLQTKTA